MSRFDYVQYDKSHTEVQLDFKKRMIELEGCIKRLAEGLPDDRPTNLALDKLEECYMWIGKAVRDDQVAMNGDAKDQPHRTNI